MRVLACHIAFLDLGVCVWLCRSLNLVHMIEVNCSSVLWHIEATLAQLAQQKDKEAALVG